MKRKIIRVGTSAAVILPKSLLEETQTKIGDEVDVSVQQLDHSKTQALPVSPEVIEWTDRLIDENLELLKQLKDA